MRGQSRIDEMWAWVVIDDDDTEGIPAFTDPNTGYWMPMVGADGDRIRSLRPMAKKVANAKQRAVELIRFTTRESMGMLRPSKPSGRTTPKKDIDTKPLAPDMLDTAMNMANAARGREPDHGYTAFDEPQLGQALVADQVIVAGSIVDGQPAVTFIFVKDGKPLPGLSLVGNQNEDVPKLITGAYEGAKQALN